MITITPQIQARIDEIERNRHQRLLKRAAAMHLMYDADYGMMWEPTVQGRCELVSAAGCTCHEYRVWQRCPHMARYVALQDGRA